MNFSALSTSRRTYEVSEMGSRGERSSLVAESGVIGNWLAIEVFASSPGFILRKIDLLRRGDVPLRGGVFGYQKTPSHKRPKWKQRVSISGLRTYFSENRMPFGRWPGRGVNWNKANKARADSVMGPPCSIVAPNSGGIPYRGNLGQKRDPAVRRSPHQGVILRRPRWLVPPEPSPYEAPSPDFLLFGKERDNRGSRHKSASAVMPEATQKVRMDTLSVSNERRLRRLSFL